MDFSDFIVNLLNAFASPIVKLAKRLRVAWHRRQLRRRPAMTVEKAIGLAEAVLHGKVLKAISYRDMGEKPTKIAALWTPEERGISGNVFILEEFAGAYRIAWESDSVYFWNGESVINTFDVYRYPPPPGARRARHAASDRRRRRPSRRSPPSAPSTPAPGPESLPAPSQSAEFAPRDPPPFRDILADSTPTAPCVRLSIRWPDTRVARCARSIGPKRVGVKWLSPS